MLKDGCQKIAAMRNTEHGYKDHRTAPILLTEPGQPLLKSNKEIKGSGNVTGLKCEGHSRY